MAERKLTDEQMADARRLEEVFIRRQKELKQQGIKISQESIAHDCGWKTQANFNSYMKGRKPIGIEAVGLMAKALNVSVSEISPTLANQIDKLASIDGQSLESMQIRPVVDEEESELEDDEFEYPHYNEVYVTGGDKELLVLESSTEPSKMKKSIARKAGASMSHTFSYNLDGDSMSPKIMDKACVTADASKKVIKDGKIYVFRHGVMRRTKYLYNRPDGGLLIRSENKDEYPDEIVPKDEMDCIEIIGWVYHWCNMEVW